MPYWVFLRPLLVSLFVGWLATDQFLGRLRSRYNIEKTTSENAVPPALIGLLERLFFTVAVAFDLPGAAVAIIAWISIKMATHWNRIDPEKYPNGRFLVFSGLLAGLVSMFFAMLGGLIIREW